MLIPLLLAALGLQAAPPPVQLELSPGTRYDSRIPTLKQVTGHDVGEEISSPEQIAAYLRALADAAPDRAKLIEYGRTYEGRPLYLLVLGSADRIRRLEEVKAGMARLADPRGLAAADAERLVRELPVIVWVLHSVHGDESSSSDAALAEAYHLLAAQGDPVADQVMRDALVLVDPLQNPDGRARFVSWQQQNRSAVPESEPWSLEHDEPWPSGRTNHYLFDMNRDWVTQTQVETRDRITVGLDYHPQVVTDLHEMGGDSTYYFAPPAEPANPYITARQREWLDVFGRANAQRFDARGFAYFAREIFDAFYPGYGDSWPMFQGALGMTFEQAGVGGLLYRREDGTILTYRDAVVRHFTAAITTMATAAANREKLLRDYAEFRRTAVSEGEKAAAREYLVPPGNDPPRTIAFGRTLVEHGIEVRRAQEPVKVGTRTLPVGTLIVSAAQPSFRLLRNLLEPDIRMDEKFLKEQERRRLKRMPEQFYDVTGWNMPLLYDVEIVTSPAPISAAATPLTLAPLPPAPAPAIAKAAYLMPWGTGAAAAAIEALSAGVKLSTAGRAFTIGSRTFAVGTAIVRVPGNTPEALAKFREVAARHDAEIVPLDSTWVDAGMSLGSDEATALKTPKILLAWDAPVSGESAGAARFMLERRYGQAVTVVRATTLREVDWRRYNVIVLPSGNYSRLASEDVVRRLRDWVSAGNLLVTLAEATRWATTDRVGLLATKTELRDGRPAGVTEEKKPAPPEPKKPFDYEQAIQPESEMPDNVPGALLRVTLDHDHWLSAGLDDEVQVLVEGNRVVTPIKLDKGRNVGVYAKRDRLLACGFAWPGSQDLLAQKAYVIDQPLGRGHVIGFAEDPNFRGSTEATALLFINAVVLGPSR